MTYIVTVSIVKTIQLHHEHIGVDGHKHSYNERYRNPKVAAENWARRRMREWVRKTYQEDTLGAAYHRQSPADIRYEKRLEARLIRMATRKFKELIK
jgi:hypothetical protein